MRWLDEHSYVTSLCREGWRHQELRSFDSDRRSSGHSGRHILGRHSVHILRFRLAHVGVRDIRRLLLRARLDQGGGAHHA